MTSHGTPSLALPTISPINMLAKDVVGRSASNLQVTHTVGACSEQVLLRITVSENTGQSNSLKISYVGAQKTSTEIIACDETDLSELRSTQLDE